MKNKELNITWLYPDLLNLHGDRGNVMALKSIGEKLGLKVNINRVDNFEDKINFEDTDIIIINPGEVKLVPEIINALNKQSAGLNQYVLDNKILLVIGTSGAAFGKKVVMLDKEIDGLNYFNMTSTEKDKVYGNDIFFYFKPEDSDDEMQIVGSQISIVDFDLSDKDIAFAKTEYGKGNNTVIPDGTEGARYKNLIFTNTLGPILVKNPWFTLYLIKTAMKAKKVEFTEKELSSLDFELEKKALNAIRKFIKNKEHIEKGM